MLARNRDFSDLGPGIREHRNALVTSLILVAMTIVFVAGERLSGADAAQGAWHWLVLFSYAMFALADALAVPVVVVHYHALSRYASIVRHRLAGDKLHETLGLILSEQDVARRMALLRLQILLFALGAAGATPVICFASRS